MSDTDHVRFGDTTIEYEVRRSARRRKTVEITLVGSGVRVAAPVTLSSGEVRDIVLRRAPWIIKHMGDDQPVVLTKQFCQRRDASVHGPQRNPCREAADVRTPAVRFDHWRFRIECAPGGLNGQERYERIRRALVDWYRGRADARLPEYVDRWWGRLGNSGRSRILIRDQRLRWGSCASDGTLRFNWRVMMLEPSLIEYVVVHELAHLTVRNHSKDYWAIVSGVMPDVSPRRRRLKEVGRALPL